MKRLIALLAVVCLLPCIGLAEEAVPVAYSLPDAPPPFAPAHEPTGDDYFADAVFIGDSMMECVEMYDLFPTANIICRSGISSADANWRIFRVRGQEEPMNIYEMTEYYPHAKIYVMLGANSLDIKRSDEALADYRVMIDDMIRRFPDSLIFVISPPPPTKKAMKTLNLGPLRWVNFRDGLLELIRERGLYFLDYYALMADDEGYMIDRYDGGDGAHPSKSGLQLMENLVRTHTLEISE